MVVGSSTGSAPPHHRDGDERPLQGIELLLDSHGLIAVTLTSTVELRRRSLARRLNVALRSAPAPWVHFNPVRWRSARGSPTIRCRTPTDRGDMPVILSPDRLELDSPFVRGHFRQVPSLKLVRPRCCRRRSTAWRSPLLSPEPPAAVRLGDRAAGPCTITVAKDRAAPFRQRPGPPRCRLVAARRTAAVPRGICRALPSSGSSLATSWASYIGLGGNRPHQRRLRSRRGEDGRLSSAPRISAPVRPIRPRRWSVVPRSEGLLPVKRRSNDEIDPVKTSPCSRCWFSQRKSRDGPLNG